MLEESEARLRVLASELMNAQEKERKVIAQELHDNLVAQLAAVKYRMEHRLKYGESAGNVTPLEETLRDINTAIIEIRRIMANLRPSVLDDLGILPALSWYSREVEGTYPGTSVEYSGNVQESDVPENLKIVLFRVVQESLTNSVRHGKSSLITIGLKKDAYWLRLRVEDNGTGFVSIKKWAAGGIGLDSMQQRVDSTGGIFSVSSTPGKGTIVKAEWRINQDFFQIGVNPPLSHSTLCASTFQSEIFAACS
jgi:signal transduction histidine kinase